MIDQSAIFVTWVYFKQAWQKNKYTSDSFLPHARYPTDGVCVGNRFLKYSFDVIMLNIYFSHTQQYNRYNIELVAKPQLNICIYT